MLEESPYLKLHISVPVKHADTIRKVLGDAGAGVQGNYTHCSGSIALTGRFIPIEGANPSIGNIGKLEEVEEELITTLCHRNKIKDVLTAVKVVHPYEEPPIDIFPRYEIQ